MITSNRADLALGRSQIMSAINQPANMALIAVGQNGPLTAARPSSFNAERAASEKSPLIAGRRAKISVPRIFAARTIAQNLKRDNQVRQSRRTSRGAPPSACFP